LKAIRRCLLVASIAALVFGGGLFALGLIEGRDIHSATTANTGIALGGPFTLVGSDGKPVTDQSYRGKLLLVYFGYTFCPDVCPTTLNNIAQALVQLGTQADAVVPVFITVDPKRDTPTAIGSYVKAFDPRIVGLSGSVAQIAIVAKEYRVYYAPQPAQTGDYLVDHSSLVYLMDRNGKFLKVFAGSLSGVEMADTIKPFIASGY
jgi:protein SCO1/2